MHTTNLIIVNRKLYMYNNDGVNIILFTMDNYIDNFTPRNNRSNQNRTRDHVISINSNVLEYSDSILESITNDSDLNEFIEDPNFNVPILGDHFRAYQYPQTSHPNQINNETIAPQYYKLEFIICLLISISANHTIFLVVDKNIDNVFLNIFRKMIHFSIISIISYLFTTADTYRSINVSIDFLPINWILYNYSIKTVVKYMLVQILAIGIGSYISIALYYNTLSTLSKDEIIVSIMAVTNINFNFSTIATILYAHVISCIGNTIIMEYTNSLTCRYNMIQRVAYLCLVSIIYGTTIGPFTLLIYRIILYLSVISVFPKFYSYDDHIFLIVGAINILIKLIIYPFIVYYTKYVWKHKMLRYIEYTQ